MPLDGATWFTDIEREILRSVREQVSKPGAWRQGQMGDGAPQRCLIGWICVESRHYHDAGQGLIDKLGGWNRLIEVNDVPKNKPQADVVAYLDRVIAGARM